MAQSGEPTEITAIRTNINGIVAAVTVGNLQWFADSLVQETFIARTAAQGILGTLGTAPDSQARQLLESVFTKLQIVEKSKRRDWFERFIAIFDDPTYAELVQKLKQGTNGSSSKGMNAVGLNLIVHVLQIFEYSDCNIEACCLYTYANTIGYTLQNCKGHYNLSCKL